jgi:hypothetical protein
MVILPGATLKLRSLSNDVIVECQPDVPELDGWRHRLARERDRRLAVSHRHGSPLCAPIDNTLERSAAAIEAGSRAALSWPRSRCVTI